MTTLRVEKRSRFATVDRRTVNDKRLSWAARGLLVWLLDKPDDWITSTDRLTRESPQGRHAVRSILHELEALGYLVRSRSRTAAGTLSDAEWIIREVAEVPIEVDSEGEPTSGFPTLDKPTYEEPTSDNRTAYRRLTPTETEKTETESDPESVASLPSEGRGLVKLDDRKTLAVARDRISREVLNRWWEGEVPRPAQPYIACQKVVSKMLEVGWSPDDVFFALSEAPVVSTGALTMALKMRKKKSAGTQTETLLAMMVKLDGMNDEEQERWWNTEGPGRLRHG